MARPLRRALLLLIPVLLIACGADDDGESLPDAGPGDPSAVRCDALPTEGPLGIIHAIDSGLQIHPWARFDGASIWIAYTATDVENSSVFDTAVLELSCQGELVGDPIRLTTTSGRSEIDPSLAIGTESIAVSWTSDSSEAENNLDIVVRAIDFDGNPLTTSDITIEPSLADGTPVPGNSFFSALAAKPGGGFVLTSSTVVPGGQTFRAVANHLQSDGTLDGALIELAPPGPDTDTDLAAVTDDAGEVWFAWTEAQAAGDRVMVAHAAADRGALTLAEPLMASEASLPSLATIGGERFYAVRTVTGGESDITLVAPRAGAPLTATIGNAGAVEHTPMLAAGEGTNGAVAFFRNLGGFRNQLVVAGFDVESDAITVGAPVEISHEMPAPPYAPTITYIGDGLYFVAWAEGMSPAFTVRGAFIRP